MYTEPMALTGYIEICKEYSNCLGIYSMGRCTPLVTDVLTGCFIPHLCPVIWEILPQWLPMNSLHLGSALDN